MVRVKICGIKTVEDAMVAVRAGADALGFVFWEGSVRYIPPEKAQAIVAALPPFVTAVGLFVDAPPQQVRRTVATTGVHVVQLHGQERPRVVDILRGLRLIKALRIASDRDIGKMMLYRVEAFVLDAYVKGQPGGTGKTFDWEIARRASQNAPIILAGGLTPGNVATAVRQARPYAVDVSSGVECRPGVKDKDKIKEFIRNAKAVALY